MIKKIKRRLDMLFSDWRWWGFYLQRQFMHPAMRRRLSAYVASRRPKHTAAVPHEAVGVACAELGSSGIAMLGELLDKQACKELHDYFGQRLVYDPYRQGSANFLPDGAGRHPSAHIAHHTAEDVLRAPYLLALANSPRILAIAAGFLGCKPTIGYLAAWWSYPTDVGAQQAERFHRDVDDWKFVKLFVYLSDVDASSGPHIYVRNSSNSPILVNTKRLADDEVIRAFGAANVLTMTGEAGQGFMEDTFGIHKGQPVERGRRLVFQVVYGISPLPYSPMGPVLRSSEVSVKGLDLWINRAYLN